MPKPTRVGAATSNLSTTSTPKTAGPVSVLAGDKVVAIGCMADENGNVPTCAPSGGGFSMGLSASDNTAGRTPVFLWTGLVDVDRSLTLSFAWTSSDAPWGGAFVVYRATPGYGTAIRVNGSGAPSTPITTGQANSAVMWGCGDWAAVAGAAAYRTEAGVFNEVGRYVGDGSQYGLAIGDHEDANAVGTYNLGMTAPAGQTWNLIGIEIKGQPAAAGSGMNAIAQQRLA